MKGLINLVFVTLVLSLFSCKKDNNDNDGEEEYQLPEGWVEVASPAHIRTKFAAILMADGKVMITGGISQIDEYPGWEPLTSCEIYDPETNTWSQVADLLHHHMLHNMTLLQDGRIFLFGGFNSTQDLSSDYTKYGEIYDPETDTWTLTPSIQDYTYGGPAVNLLPSGKVMVLGKNDAFEYDPETNTYEQKPYADLGSQNLIGAQMVNIDDTSFMVIGGGGISPHVLSIITNNLQRTYYTMNYPHSFFAAIQLLNKDILISHGRYASREHPELFNMETKQWEELDIMYEMMFGKFFYGKPGKIIAFGDVYLQEYDIASRTWTRLDRPVACWRNDVDVPAVQLPDGRIFITGGWDLKSNPDPRYAYEILETYHKKSYIYTP